MPRGYLAMCVGKSTYARCGIIVNVTPIEPEWQGRITLEISNTTPLPARIYANEGIAQLIFLKGERTCSVSYADKNGKYQNQRGLTLPLVD
jgi:dCTP deaminase